VSWPNSPEWLRELQGRFSELLRTPLDRSTGSLRAISSTYDPELVEAALPSPTLGSAERLAIYQRQYWFRLFTVLQELYPLTSRLLGYWRFNELAAHHLLERPPRGYELDAIGDDFELSVAARLSEEEGDSDWPIDPAAVLEAARVDAAFYRVTRAPHSAPFRPGPTDAAHFGDSCLRLSPAAALVQESWPLSELRARLLDRQDEPQIKLAERLPTTRHWLLLRHETKLGLLALEPREAELLDLLQRLPLEQALGRLEAAAAPAERERLPEQTQGWLARSVRVGVWVGFAEARK